MPTESDAAGGAAAPKAALGDSAYATEEWVNLVIGDVMQKVYKLQYDLTQAGAGAGQYTQQEVGRLQTLLQGEIGGLQQYVGQQIAALGKSQKDNSGLAQEVASLAKRVSALEQHSSGGGGGGGTLP